MKTPEGSIRRIQLSVLAHRCAEESDHFFAGRQTDPRYCYELLRRALQDGAEQAWELAYQQFSPVVVGWIRRHPAYPQCREEMQYFVNRAFERLWQGIGATKFNRYSELNTILSYLRLCINSAIVDHLRRIRSDELQLEAGISVPEGTNKPSLEQLTIKRLERRRLWTEIDQRLKSEKEKTVLHAAFVLGMPSREILRTFENQFTDVQEIYRIKQNLIARLRRDKGLARKFQTIDTQEKA